jgi:hypothetical protein
MILVHFYSKVLSEREIPDVSMYFLIQFAYHLSYTRGH